MGNHEFCTECGESDFHLGRPCNPEKKRQWEALHNKQETKDLIQQWSDWRFYLAYGKPPLNWTEEQKAEQRRAIMLVEDWEKYRKEYQPKTKCNCGSIELRDSLRYKGPRGEHTRVEGEECLPFLPFP